MPRKEKRNLMARFILHMRKEEQMGKTIKPTNSTNSTEKKALTLDGVHQTTHKTRDIDAKRIAIKATDEFLKENEEEIEVNRLFAIAIDYEQMIYESAKQLKLECEPLEEEKLRTRNFEPLKLHSYMKPYEGKFITIGGKDEIREFLNTKSISRRVRSKHGISKQIEKRGLALHKVRR
ncbi:MAG: hypothetical protein U9N18_01985 [Campylobacterota bacterium]|nr:hypothetical protein [Campylobacterota bacterium]